MYRIIKDGANIGLTENLNYIKQAENGCYVLCPEHDASGIVFAGTVYHCLAGILWMGRKPSVWKKLMREQKSPNPMKLAGSCL